MASWQDTTVKVLGRTDDRITIQIGPWTGEVMIETIRQILEGEAPAFEIAVANLALRLAIAGTNLGNAAAVKAALEGTPIKLWR